MNYLSARRCVLCGGLLMVTFANGLSTETCAQHGLVIACPRPPIDLVHGGDPEPYAPPMVQQFYALNTSTATTGTTFNVPVL